MYSTTEVMSVAHGPHPWEESIATSSTEPFSVSIVIVGKYAD